MKLLRRKFETSHISWWRLIVWKFIGGIICLAAGLSLGREGPSVQMGSALGQGFCKILKRLKTMFDVGNMKALPLKYYVYLIGLGIILGVMGVIFNKSLYKSQFI
jgi:H+/Cl- antiporter ClcA